MCDAAVAAGLSGAGAAAAGDITAAASTSKEASVTGAGLLEGGSKALTCEQIDKTRFCTVQALNLNIQSECYHATHDHCAIL